MNFVTSFSQARRFSLGKVIQLFKVIYLALRLRLSGKFDLLMYPAGGPQMVPIIRDIILLPILMLLANKTVVNFHAAGIAERLSKQKGVLEWLLTDVYRRVDAAVVMTQFNRRDPEALGIRYIVTIPHHIQDQNPEVRLPDFDLAKPPTFVYLGHLYDQKGTPQLIQAFSRIHRTHPETKLVLIGEFLAPYSEEMFHRDLCRYEIDGSVEWTGLLEGDEKWSKLIDCNCFVFPSIAPYESFGLVVVEAMMCGLPVLISDWRGNSDVVGSDFGGLLFPTDPSLADNIEAAMRSALEQRDKWSGWGEVNRRIYEKKYQAAEEGEAYVRWVKRRFSANDAL